MTITIQQARALVATGEVELAFDGVGRKALRLRGELSGAYFARKVPEGYLVDYRHLKVGGPFYVRIRTALSRAGIEEVGA